MNIFKTQWIVLKVKKINEQDFLYTIFFRDYGKLNVTKKKKTREKTLDIWYGVNCEIITKNLRNTHTIGNIQISHHFLYEDKSFKIIELYLKLIKTILSEIPNGSPHSELYEILCFLNIYSKNISQQQILLTYLKILIILKNLEPKHTDVTIEKILKFLNTKHIQDVFKLKWIDLYMEKTLEQII